MLFCSPTSPGSCADITHARESGLVELLAEGPPVEVLADAGDLSSSARKNSPDLSAAEWERLRPFLPVSNRRCGRWRDHRQVIDGILHRATVTGIVPAAVSTRLAAARRRPDKVP